MSPRLRGLEKQLADLQHTVKRLIASRSVLEERMDKMIRHGKVTDVDTKKQLARIEVANKDGTSTKSDWRPYAQHAGPDGDGAGNGEYKFHNPPVVGQQMTLMSPNGEWRQGIILPFTWYDKAASPSTGPDPVITYGKLKIERKKDLLRTTVDTAIREQTTDAITDTVGNATITQKDGSVIVKVADAAAEVHADFIRGQIGTSRFVVTASVAKLKTGANVIFTDPAGCWSSVAMNIKADPDGH